jgi:hypothetical protein
MTRDEMIDAGDRAAIERDPHRRPDGCTCQLEPGDSPCPVHGDEGDESPTDKRDAAAEERRETWPEARPVADSCCDAPDLKTWGSSSGFARMEGN